MKISKLEIVGFKSFADKATVIFGEGITGIVGPNGCGKSNIVDAIRWCMGEMSAKHLRGKAMQDVIFGGAVGRGPLGMAEVSLTFSNDGNFPSTYAQLSELSVTRRLFRDGRSDYLINKVVVRLKDVVDLFLGTGVGTRAYSIIEQGRIAFVLNAKPEERRRLIEEVAGITKFKARKETAERRMLSTEQNLVRVSDIVAELERQLGSLRRQAKKAERYRELKNAWRSLELHAAVLDYLRLLVSEKLFVARLHDSEELLEDKERALVSEEAEVEAQRLKLLETDHQLQRDQQLSAELDAQFATLERDLEHWRHELSGIRARAQNATGEVEQIRLRLTDAQDEQRALLAQHQALQARSTQEQQRLSDVEAQVSDLRSQLEACDDDIASLRQAAYAAMQKEMEERSKIKQLQQKHDMWLEKSDTADAEKEMVDGELQAAQKRDTELLQKQTTAQSALQTLQLEREQLVQQIASAAAEQSRCEAIFDRCKTDLTQAHSRLISLEEITQRLEGFSDGVQKLLGEGKPDLAGLLGIVTDVLQVPAEYEQAVEAVLAERLQYVVAADAKAALGALSYLREQGGRSGFIRLDVAANKNSVYSGTDVLGCAADLVTCEAQFISVVRYLLGDVVIVRDLDAAQALQTSATVVTLQGEVWLSQGVLIGGQEPRSGFLAQRRELRELREAVVHLKMELEQSQAALHAATQQRVQDEERRAHVDEQIQQNQWTLLGVKKDREMARSDLQRLEERVQTLRAVIVQCAQEMQSAQAACTASEQLADKAKVAKAEAEAELVQTQERRQVEANLLQSKQEELTVYKVEVAANDQKCHALAQALDRLQKTEQEYRDRLKRDENAITAGNTLANELMLRVEHGEKEAKLKAHEGQLRHAHLNEARARYEHDRLSIMQVEKQLKEAHKNSEQVREQLAELKIALQRLELERQHLIQQVAEKHDEHVPGIVCDYHMLPMPTEKDLQRRVELDRSIKAMGSINLAAIEECAQVEARFEFLLTQRDDLRSAIDVLQKAIVEINKKSRERFQEAFDAVNDMFQKVFPRLFRGGEARLTLTTTDDLLEAGVEIVAMPPGKKLQNVSLLSGGEKALTATALIFSIFLIKPSPFCILDEVDAPLDDANVGRFNEMLREISKYSQFIVITHNKQTMCVADRIYGITMEDAGLSKVVAVDLQGLKEQAA
jgi:chromosome segregation protein